ncbi:MAG: aminoacyl-tRNA hydrolase [Deltaproteobacteria bacterium]|nr:aminoacyl-tRNA hydrolase [Deltaproteobacteria bacterium]
MKPEVKITEKISVPLGELKFAASRSSGPGGQNVNKVSTRVTLLFDVVNSQSLSGHEKELIMNRLPTRINKQGVLRVVSQKHRTQAANRNAAVERFASLLRESLQEAQPRRQSRIPRAVKARRLAEKRHRSRIKEQRSKRVSLDD